MGRGRDDFIDRYGGMIPGESPDDLRARMVEIDSLERMIKGGMVALDDLGIVQRRLCHLKGIRDDDYGDLAD